MSAHHKDKNSTASLHAKLHQTDDDSDEDTGGEVESPEDLPLINHETYTELQNKLNEAEEKCSQYYDRMLRMQAETDNVQRRVERDVANAHKYALEKFVLDLLPVIDSMERSLEVPAGDSDKAVLEGVALTLKLFQTTLEKYGVEQVDPMGQPFNPEFHQAVSVQVDNTVAPNTVVGVLQKGYMLNKRLIKPALVLVSKAA